MAEDVDTMTTDDTEGGCGGFWFCSFWAACCVWQPRARRTESVFYSSGGSMEQLLLWLLWELLLWSLPVRTKTFVMWVRIMFSFHHHHHGESPCVTLFVAPIVTQSRTLTSSIKTFVLEDGNFFSSRFTVTVLTEEFGAFYRQQNSSHEQTISLLGSRGARVGVQCTWCT